MSGHLVKHAVLHVGCHDGVDGHNGGPHTAAPPQQVPEMLLRLRPLSLHNPITLLRLCSLHLDMLVCMFAIAMPHDAYTRPQHGLNHAQIHQSNFYDFPAHQAHHSCQTGSFSFIASFPRAGLFTGAGGNKLDVQHAKLAAWLLPRAARPDSCPCLRYPGQQQGG